MIRPILADESLAAQIAATEASPEHFHLWWLGQSGFLLAWNGHRLLLDPYLSDSLTEKYAATDKPHTRISARVIRPELLVGLTGVTASHVHTDHLDSATLQPVLRQNPDLSLFFPAAIENTVRERLGDFAALTRLVGMDAGEMVTCGAFQVHAIPAAHNTVERDSSGRCRFLGFVIRFGRFALWHSGDTLWHEDLVARLLPHRVDVALVPINGNEPSRRVAGNLNGTEAAAVAKAIGAGVAVPHHFDLFAFNTADPAEFQSACHRVGQHQVTLQLGAALRWPQAKEEAESAPGTAQTGKQERELE